MSCIDKDNSNKELTENIRNRVRENRDNSPYEEQQLSLRTTEVKKISPPKKIGKTKQILGKTVLGKNKGGGDKKKTQTKF